MTQEEAFTERLVERYGERYRLLIEDALRFLLESEPKWGLNTPSDKEEFIAELIRKAT
jgi:hypothetical protein